MSKKKQTIQENYRLDNALKELGSCLKTYKMITKLDTRVIILAEDNEHIYMHNGIKCELSTPILLTHLELMVKQVERGKTK